MKAKSRVLRALSAVATIALCAIGALYIYINAGFSSLGSGPEHRFTVDPQPPVLTESLALAKARESLALDGFHTNEWEPQPHGSPSSALPAAASGGSADKFLKRASWATNAGIIVFYKLEAAKPSEPLREYRGRLEGNIVTCGSYRGP